MTTLIRLSMQRCRRHELPAAPSNEDRYRALRSALPVYFGNSVFSYGDKTALAQARWQGREPLPAHSLA